jgi:hypothetical protein
MKRSAIANVLLPSLTVCALLGLCGCESPRQVSQDQQSGFLGDYSMLRKGGVKQANYLFIDQGVNWAKYTKIWLKPVELWHAQGPESPLGKMSKESQQMLVDSFRVAMVQALTNDFQLVDFGGADVLVIRAALTDGRFARPVIGVVSSVYAPLKVYSYSQRRITGNDLGVGEVVIEVDVTDGQTGQRVGAVIDAREGAMALPSKYDSIWNDVKLAFEWFGQRLDKRFMLAKEGKFSTSSL